jgi:hypothetical protein
MIISFMSNKVSKLCTKRLTATKQLGDSVSLALYALLEFLTSATNLNDAKAFRKYRVHALENKNHENRLGQVSLSIPSSSFRLIVIPVDSNGVVWNAQDELTMMSTFPEIRVKEVIDYHE